MNKFKIVNIFEHYLINIQIARDEWKYEYLERIQTPTLQESYDLIQKKIMFPIGIIKSAKDMEYLKDHNYFSTFPTVYNSRRIPVDSLVEMAMVKNVKSMPTSEESETWIEGNEVLYINAGLQETVRYPKDLYIKYFWLFYIVAVDFWDKYPQHVYVEIPDYRKNQGYTQLKKYRDFVQDTLNKAVKEAKRNLPWAQEAEKMVEEKKKRRNLLD